MASDARRDGYRAIWRTGNENSVHHLQRTAFCNRISVWIWGTCFGASCTSIITAILRLFKCDLEPQPTKDTARLQRSSHSALTHLKNSVSAGVWMGIALATCDARPLPCNSAQTSSHINGPLVSGQQNAPPHPSKYAQLYTNLQLFCLCS